MCGLSKVGQVGMEPNPQMKMMLYIMPVMMTFLFLNFASGLNLYYAVSNIASIPQQWMLARERLKTNAAPVAVDVKPAGGRQRGSRRSKALSRAAADALRSHRRPRHSARPLGPRRGAPERRPARFAVAARVIDGFRADRPRVATLATFRDADGEPIDRGLYTVFPGPAATPARTWSSSPAMAGCSRPPGCSPRSTPPARGPRRRASSPAAPCSTASSTWSRPRRWAT